MSKCRSCNAEIVWFSTKGGKLIPVDAETYHGETKYDSTVHRSHFATCPNADQHRKVKPKFDPDETAKSIVAEWEKVEHSTPKMTAVFFEVAIARKIKEIITHYESQK